MKLTITIDSDDYKIRKGRQYCDNCPLSYLCNTSAQGTTEDCTTLFKQLFGKHCDEIEVSGKPIVTTSNISLTKAIEQLADAIRKGQKENEEKINNASMVYADSKLKGEYSKNEERKLTSYDWCDLADAFEEGANWVIKNILK